MTRTTARERKLLAALALIQTLCTESDADLRKRGGTRLGNILEAVRKAGAL